MLTNPILDHFAATGNAQQAVGQMHTHAHATDALVVACGQGHVELVRCLLEEVDATVLGNQPLLQAVAYNHLPVVEVLLPHITEITRKQVPVLFWAAEHKNLSLLKALMELVPFELFDNGDVNQRGSYNLLEICVNIRWKEGAQYILALNAGQQKKKKPLYVDPKESDCYALRLACEIGDMDLIKMLAPVSSINYEVLSAVLLYGPPNQTIETLDFLHAANPKGINWDTVVATALDNPIRWDVVRHGLDKALVTTPTARLLLLAICASGDAAVFEQHRQVCSSVKLESDIMDEAIRGGSAHIVRALLEQGCPLPSDGLCSAARAGHVEVAQLMLAHFNPKFNDSFALVCAVQSKNSRMVELLLPLTNPRARNSEALSQAVEKNNLPIVELLLPHSNPAARQSDLLVSCVSNSNMDLLERLLECCCAEDDNSMPLRVACGEGKIDFVKRLLPISDVTADGYAAVCNACENERLEVLLMLLDHPEVADHLAEVEEKVHDKSSHAYGVYTDALAQWQNQKLQSEVGNSGKKGNRRM